VGESLSINIRIFIEIVLLGPVLIDGDNTIEIIIAG